MTDMSTSPTLGDRAWDLTRRALKKIGLEPKPKFDPLQPFGPRPRAPRDTYQTLYDEAVVRSYPQMDAYLQGRPHAIDRDWMNALALHTQVVVKPSRINFQHGRLLYALLRDRLDALPADAHATVLETGTSRGFSIICMARAMADAGRDGKLVTFDIIGHHRRHFWNCIDDADGPKTRAELLEPWAEYRDRVVFVAGDSKQTLPTVALSRIHFAFLDGAHTEQDVLDEFAHVQPRQQPGDVIVFDDVTESAFPGIVAAMKTIEARGDYAVEYLSVDENRGYAIAQRL